MNARTLNAHLFTPSGGLKAQDLLAVVVRGIALGFWTAVTDLAVEAKEAGEDYRSILHADLDFPEAVELELELHGINGPEGVVWAVFPA